MIRPATVADIPRIIELGKQMSAESVTYRNVPWDDTEAAAFLEAVITDIGVIFLYERENEIIGGFGGGITNHWFSKEKYGFDFFLFVHPSSRSGVIAIKLVSTFESFCRMQGAKTIHCGITTGVKVESTSRLYEAMEYKPLGPLFIKEL
jgi:GNAT superfamily N-acetyltransferase